MKYNYTWNHLLLFAKICGGINDGDSVTASWVNIIEEHHAKTFPFTLWPLTYRTSDVTTSPSISSPIYITSKELNCAYEVKMYRCNEVIIICIQHNTSFKDCTKCTSPRNYDLGECDDKDHHKMHSVSLDKPLLPCSVAHCYYKIKTIILERLEEFQEDEDEKPKCIICIGHDFSAAMASCLANDIGKVYETQREFLGLEEKEIDVDFIGFSSPILASSVYWKNFEGSIDKYITVHDKRDKIKTNSKVRMIVNPNCSNIIIEKPIKQKRHSSIINMNILQQRVEDITKSLCINEYVSLLDSKIKISIDR